MFLNKKQFKSIIMKKKFLNIKFTQLKVMNQIIKLTRTAWAVFKYCATKTATLSLSIRS